MAWRSTRTSTRGKSAPAWLLGALLAGLWAAPSQAAQITEVADAIDGDDPFDANLDVSYRFTREGGAITREAVDANNRGTTNRELEYERLKHTLVPRLEVGLFRDLSIFAELPVVLSDTRKWWYADGVNNANSTLNADQSGPAPGLNGWGEDNYGYPHGLPGGPKTNEWRLNDGAASTQRAGFDRPTFGLRFSPLNNARDASKPSITLQGDYRAPVFGGADPWKDAATGAEPGAVAVEAHEFHVSVAMSKRAGVLDPFFKVDYTIPFASSGNNVAGFMPQQSGGFTMGMEIVPYESAVHHQRFAVLLAGNALYKSEGRVYSPVADLLQDLTYVEQSMQVGGGGGLFFQAGQYASFDVSGRFWHDTQHLLTSERLGSDASGNGQVELDPAAGERSQYFNPVVDAAGRRLKLESAFAFEVGVHASIMF